MTPLEALPCLFQRGNVLWMLPFRVFSALEPDTFQLAFPSFHWMCNRLRLIPLPEVVAYDSACLA